MANARAHAASPEFRIESLPSVGPALAGRLRAAFGSDAAFHAACETLELDPLFAVEGLSERRAFDLVAAVRREPGSELSATERAREIRRDLEDQLAAHASTSYGRRAVRLLPVLRDAESIAEHEQRVLALRDRIEGLDRRGIATALAALAPLREPARAPGLHRVILVDDEDQEFELRQHGLDRHCQILPVRQAREGLDPSELVLYAGDEAAVVADLEACVEVGRDAPVAEFVPEIELEFVNLNRRTLEALEALAASVGKDSAAPACLAAARAADAPSPANLRTAAEEALRVATRELEAAAEQVSLRGKQVLELLSSPMPSSLVAARARAVEAGRARFREIARQDWDPFEAGLPLRIDDEGLRRLEAVGRSRAAVNAFRRRQEAARAIAAARGEVTTELRHWVRWDVEFALASWALDVGAQAARTSDQLRFEAAHHLRFLRAGNSQPISYRLGGPDPIAVLTGANSGGKSSLLELVAQLLILHHWGLPVPAREAEIPIVDELLFFAASRGATAGAFETFLEELFPPLTRPGRRFLLLDEVEGMTELEAAGRILGVFLGEVRRAGALCVLVTHLPTEVLAHARVPVRIDGIDAVGLDEHFNLVVDRQPKLGHRARSTPELILRRVHARARGPERALYERILAAWS